MHFRVEQNHLSQQIRVQIGELGFDQIITLTDRERIKMEDSDFCRVHVSLRSSNRIQARINSLKIDQRLGEN
jgi:hypothetical protein